ncbi:hypothetical protein GGE65_004637 [Skermanella aerolata]|jgi:hypothetical protein|uniref:Uncharacterized protein n=1 Tax=Skermanella aerolata TaxID=393310 RepID=A0A512E0P6_9PROT|nr:hypothetical protein [Skermanella aerolata]KJB90459.1 hypothetical protein N826_41140 [Skermanella aerolata KACC 11604]GEO42259.1 hypothetical protein SAE02_64070 [Skermanella aerolata]
MQKMNTISPTVNHVFHAFGMNFQNTFANLRHRIEGHLETRRLRAELEFMSERERQEIDVTLGNTAWAARNGSRR